MKAAALQEILDFILRNFRIRYDDFGKEEYAPYRERKIVGFVRFDRREIFFDKGIGGRTEEITWAHEALSIYYYSMLRIIRHDDDVEKEAKELCRDETLRTILREYIYRARLAGGDSRR